MADVNTAVTLIKSGQKEEAQAILKEIIRAEPHNIPAWFWMVETLETDTDKLRVMEVCLKLNPGETKVQKAYEMLKEVQASDSGESFAPDHVLAGEPDSPPPGEAVGPEKEIPAAGFAEVPVIQESVDQFAPPAPEPETSTDQDISAAVFAAVPVINAAADQYGAVPPAPGQEKPAENDNAVAEVAAAAAIHTAAEEPVALAEEEDKSHGAAVAAVGTMAAVSAAQKPPSSPLTGAKPQTPPFVEEKPASPAVVAASAAVPPLEPVPPEAQAQKQRKKRSWKWLIPAVLISFVVFLCAGISFIYIRQLFP
jgi:hypothetical protein